MSDEEHLDRELYYSEKCETGEKRQSLWLEF